MRVHESVEVSQLIFEFTNEDQIFVITQFIKINEFNKQTKEKGITDEINLYSLDYKIHKHAHKWIVVYGYCTLPTESLYDPPIYNICIKVPIYTEIFVKYNTLEDLIKKRKTRRVLVKRKAKKLQNIKVFSAYSII
ncbi:hypothetical protein MrNuV_ORF007 [Macrobrachium rosenbergii nudivirus]|nr:hypothetical protein MrNuV_ORF007 [Macrobrachium rosenbergii nudivirus]